MSTMFKTTFALGMIGLSLVACGKKDEAPASGSTSITAATAATGATGAAANGAAAAAAPAGGGADKILAQCMNKQNHSCKETYRLLPLAAEEFCKGLDGTGVFTKGDKACPKEDLISTCEFAGQEQTEITYHYLDKSMPLAAQIEGAKLGCSIVDGKFVEAPKPADNKAPAGKPAPAAKKK